MYWIGVAVAALALVLDLKWLGSLLGDEIK